ncbi:hypothetical protein CIB48_g9666 [Xylaria polymorpha]|nr:hypothetical protein CIB48_g9666 [Xylaria polymorpha]
MFGYGSKRLLRSIDQSTIASTLTLRQPGPEQARDGWTKNDPASIGRVTTRGPVSAARTGCSGGAVLGHEGERGAVVHSIAQLLIPSWRLSVLPRREPTACSTSGET